MTAIFTPFLNGDFKRAGDRDFRLAGFVRLAKKVTESFLHGGLTLGYRQQFFGPQYVLLAGMDWKASGRLRLFGDLPQLFTVSYRCGEQVHAGLSYVANLFSYDVSGQSRYFRYSYVHSGLFSEFSLTKNIVLRADAGYSFARKFEVFDDADRPDATLIFFQIGNKPVPLNAPLQKGLVFLDCRLPTGCSEAFCTLFVFRKPPRFTGNNIACGLGNNYPSVTSRHIARSSLAARERG